MGRHKTSPYEGQQASRGKAEQSRGGGHRRGRWGMGRSRKGEGIKERRGGKKVRGEKGRLMKVWWCLVSKRLTTLEEIGVSTETEHL